MPFSCTEPLLCSEGGGWWVFEEELERGDALTLAESECVLRCSLVSGIEARLTWDLQQSTSEMSENSKIIRGANNKKTINDPLFCIINIYKGNQELCVEYIHINSL